MLRLLMNVKRLACVVPKLQLLPSLDAQPQFDYDAIPEGYYDEVYQRGRGAQSKWHHLKFRCVREHLGTYVQLLDLGCGPGSFVGSLSEPGHAIGVDIAAAQIAYAQRHYGGPQREFQTILASGLPYATASFDVVTSIEVIEHLDRETTCSLLAEAWRVLRPGGRLVLTTPNYASPWPLMEWFVNRLFPVTYEAQHISHYTPKRLRDLLQEITGVPAKVTAFQGFEFALAMLHWSLPDRLPKPLRHLPPPFGGMLLLGIVNK